MNIRTIAILPALAALAIGLTGCSSLALSHVVENNYPDRAALMKHGDAVFRDASWVPKDAQSIATKVQTDKPGNIITFASRAGVSAPSTCTAGPLTGKPKLTAGWWPKHTPKEGQVCGRWQVFQDEGDWYGWTNKWKA